MDILTIKMNGNDYGLLLDEVAYIVGKADNIRMIPNAHAHIRGIAKVSGEDVPVYSLFTRLGFQEPDVVDLVAVHAAGMKVALEVGKADAIIHVEDDMMHSVPTVLNGEPSGFKSFASQQKKLIAIVDVEHLLSQEERAYIRGMLADNAEEENSAKESPAEGDVTEDNPAEDGLADNTEQSEE